MMKLISWSWIIMELMSKKSRGKRKKKTGIQKRMLIDTPFAKNVSSVNIYILILFCQWYDEVPSTQQNVCWEPQIVNWFKVIQEVFLPQLKLQTRNKETKHNFLQKKTLEKGKSISYCLLYLLSHHLMDGVIE